VDTEATSLSFDTPALLFEIPGTAFGVGLTVSCFETDFARSSFLATMIFLVTSLPWLFEVAQLFYHNLQVEKRNRRNR